MPAVVTGREQMQDESKSEQENGGSGGNGGGNPPEIDPIIRGLLKRLPKSGDVWIEAERNLWLDLLKGSFKLIYKDKEAAN